MLRHSHLKQISQRQNEGCRLRFECSASWCPGSFASPHIHCKVEEVVTHGGCWSICSCTTWPLSSGLSAFESRQTCEMLSKSTVFSSRAVEVCYGPKKFQ